MKHSFEKGLGVTTLWGWVLGAALAACSGNRDMAMAPDGPGEGPGEKPQRLTVFFEENCAGSQELHASITFTTPPDTLGALPEAPSCEGHVFVGWNTQRDGGGTAFHAQTPVSGNLSVYAQWEALDGWNTQLQLQILSDDFTLTPIKMGEHDESTATFSVEVSAFEREADADSLELHIAAIDGLSFETTSTFDGGTKTFTVTVAYDGEETFEEGVAHIQLNLENLPPAYAIAALPSLHIPIVDGKDKARRIPVHAGNIHAFNAYADTEKGLTLHYKLTEDVKLEAPEEPDGSNWVPIGSSYTHAFTGSFDGGGYALKGLSIYAPDSDFQGLFGYINGRDIVVENVVLTDLNVFGNRNIGGLAGMKNGTIRNSYVSGNITGNSTVGGLVGMHGGTVQNSYATVKMTGNSFIGGLVGINLGTVENSYAEGSMEGDASVAGLVGVNGGTVQNSYATGNVAGKSTVGGLVAASQGTVRNSYATGSVTGSNYVGGLLGENINRLENSVALNASLTFTTDSDSKIGRVLGLNDLEGTRENNHARDDMAVSYDYDNSNTPYVPSPAPDGNDGADVTAEEYGTKEFWEGLGFNFTEDWAWNDSTRLPVLRGVGGEQSHQVD